MTLFNGKSVIIVGAGGSSDLGLPLGGQLWDDIRSNIHWLVHEAALFENDADRARAANDPKTFAYLSAIAVCHQRGMPNISPASMATAVSLDPVYGNADEFTRNNPSIADPIGALVAANLFERLYVLKEKNWTRRPELLFTKLANKQGSGHIENWMVRFVGLCREMRPDATTALPVRVINFNYDSVFETILRELWGRAELQYPPFDCCFEFLYPYGAFSGLPGEVDAAEFMVREYRNLRVGGAGSTVVDAIRAAIATAERVFTVGFAFSPSNVRLLGLAGGEDYKKLYANGRIRVQNCGNQDLRLARTLEALFPGRAVSECETGGADRLVANGFFEH